MNHLGVSLFDAGPELDLRYKMRLEPLGEETRLDHERIRAHQLPETATTIRDVYRITPHPPPAVTVDIEQELILIQFSRLLESRKLNLAPVVSKFRARDNGLPYVAASAVSIRALYRPTRELHIIVEVRNIRAPLFVLRHIERLLAA